MRIRRVHETPENAWKGLPKRTPPPHLTMPVGWLGWLGKPKPAAVFHTPENYDLLKLDGWMLKYPKKNGPLFRWHSCINRWLGMNGTTVEKRWKKKQPPRVYHGQPTYPAPKIYLYENRFSIHLTLSSLGVFSRKKTGLQSVPMASQKLLILTGLGNPEMDMIWLGSNELPPSV